MDITLRVTPEALKTKANEVEGQIKALETEFNTIQDLVSRTSGYWIGEAGERARAEFESQREDIDTILKRFKEHPIDLMKMAGVYDEAVQAALAQNQTLETDIIV